MRYIMENSILGRLRTPGGGTDMRIGITPYCHDGNIHDTYIPEGYQMGLLSRGAEMVVFEYAMKDEELVSLLGTVDGFLFSGGPDVAPARYGRAVEPKCGEINLRRDEVEFLLFPLVLRRDMPVLAICRGIQMVNVALGGTLIQHVDGHQMREGIYAHELTVKPGSRLHELAGSGRILTNSYHHQMVDDLAPSLEAVAWTDDGRIEAAVRPRSRFLAAYQWHPEVTLKHDDPLSHKIFDDFIDHCKG